MNTEELVGAAALVMNDVNNLVLPDRIWKAVWAKPTSPYFIWQAVNHFAFRDRVTRISSGTSGSMKNISQKNYLGLSIIVPSIDLQYNFAERVQKIENQKESMTTSLKELEDNFNSLMQRAFKGELNV